MQEKIEIAIETHKIKKQTEQKPFNVDTCSKDELILRCKQIRLSSHNTDLAVAFFIDKTKQSIIAEQLCIDEKTLCLTTNMLYSDYCDVLRNYIPTDKEPYVYVALAKAFLDDEDAAVDGDEKLAAYYFAIVKGEMY